MGVRKTRGRHPTPHRYGNAEKLRPSHGSFYDIGHVRAWRCRPTVAHAHGGFCIAGFSLAIETIGYAFIGEQGVSEILDAALRRSVAVPLRSP